jgi:hypothetical protein
LDCVIRPRPLGCLGSLKNEKNVVVHNNLNHFTVVNSAQMNDRRRQLRGNEQKIANAC